MKSAIFTQFVLLVLFSFNVLKIQAQGIVQGQILDKSSGNSLVGVKVSLINTQKLLGKPHQTNTKDDGSYELNNVPTGLYDLYIELPNYVPQRAMGLLIGEKTSKTINLRLRRQYNLYDTEPEQVYTFAAIQARYQQEITTASMQVDKLMDAPGTVYVVTQREIQERGYSYLNEVLEDIPEIELQDKASSGIANLVSMRGIDGVYKMLLLQDGVRISSFANSTAPLDKNLGIAHADRIEVLLGPASAIYGADAFIGVVNIITKKAQGNNGMFLNSSYGMFNTIENTGSITFSHKKFSMLLSGNHYYSNEPQLYKYYPTDYKFYTNEYSQTGANLSQIGSTDTFHAPIKPFAQPRQAYSLAAKFNYGNFTLGFQRNYQQHSTSIEQNPDIALYWKELQASNATTNAYLSHFWNNKNLKWRLNTLLNWNWYEYGPNARFAAPYNNYKYNYGYASDHTLQWNEAVTYQHDSIHQFQLGTTLFFTDALPATGLLPSVWQRGKSVVEQNQYYPGTNVTWIDGRDTQILQNINRYQQFNFGAFAQYKGVFSKQLYVTVGGRFDYNSRTRIGGEPLKGSFATFNPRIGVVWNVVQPLVFKLFYGEGFVAPPFEKAFSDFTTISPVLDSATGRATGFDATYVSFPNINLKPEKIRTAEYSLLYTRKNFALTFNNYFNFVQNPIQNTVLLDSGLTYLGIPVSYAEQFVNRDKLFSMGFTVRAEYGKMLDKKERLELRGNASYSFCDGYFSNDGDLLQLPYTAKHTVKASVVFRAYKFSLNVRMLFRSASVHSGVYDETLQQIVQLGNPGFVIFNLFANYRVFESYKTGLNIDVFVKVRNLFDNRYYNSSINYAGAFNASPQDPIRLQAGVRVSFAR